MVLAMYGRVPAIGAAMHEMAIAQTVVAIACSHASGRRVASVELRVGHLRQVVPSALAFAFDLAAVGTEVEGARLAIEQVPARCRCRACGAESEQEWFPLACDHCGALDVDVVAGEELLVESLEVLNESEEGEPWQPTPT
jgi:hydrogenase nickel incorporation protein HypA/HybF